MRYDEQESLAYAKHLLAEHRRVHTLLNDIRQRWSLTPDTSQHPALIAELHASVSRLREELANHFREEEEGGILEEAAARRPGLGKDAYGLMDEHADLLAHVDRVLAALQAGCDTGELAADVHSDFVQFVARLHAHESAENRMLEQGFGVEVP